MFEIKIAEVTDDKKIYVNGVPDLTMIPNGIMDCFVTALLNAIEEISKENGDE